MTESQTTAPMPRTPTGTMVEAGRQAGDFFVRPGDDDVAYKFEPANDYAEVRNIWEAMFDAWLKECQQHD